MFSKELELSISQAYQEARDSRHEYLTVEHMLLALLDNASALSILSACGADVAGLEKDLRKVLADTVPLLEEDDGRDTQPTIGFQRVLQRALYHVQSAGKDEVLGANVLVAIFSERDSYASYLLNRYDVSRLDVVNYISHGITTEGMEFIGEDPDFEDDEEMEDVSDKKQDDDVGMDLEEPDHSPNVELVLEETIVARHPEIPILLTQHSQTRLDPRRRSVLFSSISFISSIASDDEDDDADREKSKKMNQFRFLFLLVHQVILLWTTGTSELDYKP